MKEEKELQEIVKIIQQCSNNFQNKEVYIKSTIQYKNNEFYTNYNKFRINNYECFSNFFYLYGPSNDKIIIEVETIVEVELKLNNENSTVDTMIIISEANGFKHRFEMKII